MALVAAPLAFQPAAVAGGTSGAWSTGPAMTTARSGHTATTMTGGAQAGQVLVAGGHAEVDHRYNPCCTSDSLNTAERYNPGTSTWTAVGSMAEARSHHTATPLPDGRVVVAGGYGDGLGTGTAAPNALRTVEVYTPASATTGTWTRHECAAARYNHTATLLSDGNVLLVGGQNEVTLGVEVDNVEVFNPTLGTCTPTAPLVPGRAYHTATLLSQAPCPSSLLPLLMCDRVLVAGGVNAFGPAITNADLFTYVPGTAQGTWAPAAPLNKRRQGHTATRLEGTAAQCGVNCGKVLVAGGMTEPPNAHYLRVTKTAELYDPVSGTWTYTSDMVAPSPQPGLPKTFTVGSTTVTVTAADVAGRRYLHTATKLSDGKVLVVGGNDTVNNGDPLSPTGSGSISADTDVDPATNTSEVYTPSLTVHNAGTWSQKGSLVSTHGCSAYVDDGVPPAPTIPASTFNGCRLNHEASLVTVSGVQHVLVTGGASNNTGIYPPYYRELPGHPRASAELYSTGLASNAIGSDTVIESDNVNPNHGASAHPTYELAAPPGGLTAAASGQCLIEAQAAFYPNENFSDPYCLGHWEDASMYYHWGPVLSGSGYGGQRDHFLAAVDAWESTAAFDASESAKSPDGPWHTHYHAASSNHPEMVFIQDLNNESYGFALLEQPDADHHLPRFREFWLRRNIDALDCYRRSGEIGKCTWYTGAGKPGPWELDAQSVWTEELGHLQNLTHYSDFYNLPVSNSPPPGHENHPHDHTMSGTTHAGEIDKRKPLAEDHQRACEFYSRAHSGYTCLGGTP